MIPVLDVLERLQAQAVVVEVDVDGVLSWRCETGAPSPELLDSLGRHRDVIVATIQAQREASR